MKTDPVDRASSPLAAFSVHGEPRPTCVRDNLVAEEANLDQTTADAWHCLVDGPHSGAFNMALDEALLEAAPALGQPLLRFYEWTEPAATFGYFQAYAEVARLTALRPLVRRPTGGGLVPHDRDYTYTLVVPPTHDWYRLRARDSYRRVHDWLRHAFGRLGWQTELASIARVEGPGQCFIGAEQFDVLWQGAKIAGAAQRRTRSGLLIQGSLQPPSGAPARGAWQEAMRKVAEEHWSVRWRTFVVPAIVLDRAEQLATGKYGHADYNQRRIHA